MYLIQKIQGGFMCQNNGLQWWNQSQHDSERRTHLTELKKYRCGKCKDTGVIGAEDSGTGREQSCKC